MRDGSTNSHSSKEISYPRSFLDIPSVVGVIRPRMTRGIRPIYSLFHYSQVAKD